MTGRYDFKMTHLLEKRLTRCPEPNSLFFPNRVLGCFLRYDRVGNGANIIFIHEVGRRGEAREDIAWNLTFFFDG